MLNIKTYIREKMKRYCVFLFMLAAAMMFTDVHAANLKSSNKAEGVPSRKVLAQIHPWYGARVAFLGDSQTDPRNSGSKKKYWGFLSEWLDIQPYVYGISGQQWSHIPAQVEKLHQEHGTDVDAILILMGTNDYNHGVRIGQWYEEGDTVVEAAYGQMKRKELRHYRRFSYDPNTFRGRINRAMRLIKEYYTDKQVVLLTPVHRAIFDASDKNLQPEENIESRGGLYQDAYVESVKEAGNVWAVPVIDTNALTGFFPLIQGTVYYHNAKDLLHPNDAGHERLAKTLLWQLSKLPCRF